MEIQEAASLAFKNQEALQESNFCSCYHCLQKLKFEDIKDWTDMSMTAICPHCSVDAVLPSDVPEETLKQMRGYWFGDANSKLGDKGS